ncbi:MAG: hypothetical protein F6K31_13820 [Symploca sp. SIO2G7]|nr:hypothetical protein [Symploca sp. SIO2G7]
MSVPRKLVELQLSQIWSEVLNIPTPGVRNSFFDLGGHTKSAYSTPVIINEVFFSAFPDTWCFLKKGLGRESSLV